MFSSTEELARILECQCIYDSKPPKHLVLVTLITFCTLFFHFALIRTEGKNTGLKNI